MAQLEVIDETWIAAPAEQVAALVADPRRCRQWWPEGELTVAEDRGREGIRWRMAPGRPLNGSVEIWVEAVRDGAVLHYFIRADRAGRPWSRRALAHLRRAHEVRAKQTFWAVKDELEAREDADAGRVT